MKRKVISMALALCLLMPVVGCGGNEGNYKGRAGLQLV